MTASDRLGVLKHPGEAPEIVRLREGDERFIIGDVAEHRPFNMLGTQQVAFDENFIAKGLAPNIMHPMYRSYCELRGPVVIVGVDRETGDPRSLEPREAQQIVAKLGELSITVPERGTPERAQPRAFDRGETRRESGPEHER